MVLIVWSKVSNGHIEFLILTVSLICFKSKNGLAYTPTHAKQGLVMPQRMLSVLRIIKEAIYFKNN